MTSPPPADPRIDYTRALDALVGSSSVVVDRPRESAHPRYGDVVYPLDYGYLDGTDGGDGEGIDVWLGASGSRRVTGVVLTIDLSKRDAEQKVLLGCTPGEATVVAEFHDSGDQRSLLLWRPA